MMDNFELHEEATRLTDSHSAYMLAKMLLIEQKARIELAAHVERLQQAGKAIRHELAQWALTERDSETTAAMSHFDHVASETPTTNLARRDLIKQVEALETEAEEWPADKYTECSHVRESILESAADLRQQANQLETD